MLQATYDPLLVVLSVLVSILAGFTTLSLSERIGQSQGARMRQVWLLGTSAAFGGGIWSMHFIAMLAYDVGVPIQFDLGPTVLSLMLAICFTYLGVRIAFVHNRHGFSILLAGALMGAGVASMHYTGMAAMQMAAIIIYNPLVVAASVVIGIAASTASLWLSLKPFTVASRFGAGLAMGLAIIGMHYTGMAAVTCKPIQGDIGQSGAISSELIGISIAVLTTMILMAAIGVAIADRHISNEFRRLGLEIDISRAAEQAADLRASLSDELKQKNLELEVVNREIREAQMQLVHSAKMVALAQLVAGIAHEVNTPLAFSLSHLSTVSRILTKLAEEVEGKLSDASTAYIVKAKNRIDVTVVGLERIRDLVRKLRTFSRLDDEGFKHTDFRNDIESTITFMRSHVSDRVSVVMKFAENNTIYCAPGLLNQVVMSVFANAIDAIETSGVIEIETQMKQDWYDVLIRDNGRGIAKSIRDRIFEPFFTTKDVVPGAGLGLSIAYQLVLLHHGRIELRQPASWGTEFVICIPRNLETRVPKLGRNGMRPAL